MPPLLALALLAPPAVLPKGPAVVVLLKDGCPCARECRFALNALVDACRGRVTFVGIVDADAARARAMARDAELRFPVLPDPRGVLIRSLGGKEGLDLRLLGASGAVLGRWDGLDRANVAALAARLRSSKGIGIEVDEGPFTTLPRLGCAFAPPQKR